MSNPVRELHSAVVDAASELRGKSVELPELARPPKPELGDYSSNAAMLLAPGMGGPPREIAEQLGEALGGRLGSALERVEVAGPGFLNLFMSNSWCTEALAGALAAGDDYGAGDPDTASG